MKRIARASLFRIFVVFAIAFLAFAHTFATKASVKMYGTGGITTEIQSPEYVDLPPQVEAIAQHLREAAGFPPGSVEFAEFTVPYINAFAFGGDKIAITSGYLAYSLKHTGNYSFTIGTIAHELGHLAHKDNYKDLSNEVDARNAEREADYYGIELMYKAGYDCDINSQDWATLVLIQGLPGSELASSDHPSSRERVTSAVKMCTALKKTGKRPSDMYLEKE